MIYGREDWPVKIRLDKIEMSMIKWVCTFMVKRGKYGAQEIFGIRTSQLGDLRSVDLRWFGYSERMMQIGSSDVC